ncbi:MAG: ATP-dependent Clp protease ATP-binding subunit [Verrucomicrobiae bacterium]|nr:ATP-dependent Clp protease ATP-binding subunit [Verrucomicrobiae bacterium]MCP5551656.1 ATP-dependent Clp protease ATP-binding subunit [Akkermansiaceae bacterium]
MTTDVLEHLRGLDAYLQANIIGQDHVVPKIVPIVQNGELGLADAGRPKGTFLFLGPTGVGKTEITLLITRYLFEDDKKHCIRLDMSEYQNQESLQLLLGQNETSRGQIGRYHDRAEGRGVILFDEIEKAHPRVLDIFLQVLDAGRITVATGETLDLTRFYIVATSNIGAEALMDVKNSSRTTIERFIEDLAASELRPEVLARFGVRCVFSKLGYDSQKKIAGIMLNRELRLLREKGHDLAPGPGVLEFLVAAGIEPRLGARKMRTTVETKCREAVREAMLAGRPTDGVLQLNHGSLEIHPHVPARIPA